MLFSILFSSGTVKEKLIEIVFCVCSVLFVLTAHEFAHALTAYLLGDSTAKNCGRLTMNPAKHLNPVGFLALLLCGWGWANPVPIDPRYFKGNKRAGVILTSAAGPLMNFLIGFLSVFFICLIYRSNQVSGPLGNLSSFLYILAWMSIGLGVFNLIPLPPLDGSKILGELLPAKARYKYYEIERYSLFIFLALIALNRYLNIIGTIDSLIFSAFLNLAGMILL